MAIAVLLLVTRWKLVAIQPARSNSTTPVDQTTDRICSALFALRKMAPQHSGLAPTPFELLRLDPQTKPFSPAESSAYPGSEGYLAVHEQLREAEARVRAEIWSRYARGDESLKPVVEALWHVGYMLRDDETRFYFLTDIQPRFNRPSAWKTVVASVGAQQTRADVVDGLCWGLWSSKGWVDV
ncbi:hypothetical protein ColTof4_01422 [Colletotrichum tofieldiae]|nr:hypothetical protein ColTof3_08679 [Colletotrichum tofieldiae]GKT68999.1 hypothetical protein ColTof4_01422 [Colletotrichum tofieldiae]GKT96864.1 hypothetical protein Ct61P_14714 [Colletotrichum tofieldiae]